MNFNEYRHVLNYFNDHNIRMGKAVKLLEGNNEPDWFDFDEWYDHVPIAGFIDGVAIIQDDNGYWSVVHSDYSGYWKKDKIEKGE